MTLILFYIIVTAILGFIVFINWGIVNGGLNWR